MGRANKIEARILVLGGEGSSIKGLSPYPSSWESRPRNAEIESRYPFPTRENVRPTPALKAGGKGDRVNPLMGPPNKFQNQAGTTQAQKGGSKPAKRPRSQGEQGDLGTTGVEIFQF